MWSDRYYYLNIYKDNSLSKDTDTSELKQFISKSTNLLQTGDNSFKSSIKDNFTDLHLLKIKNINSYNSKDTNLTTTNFISVITSKVDSNQFNQNLIELIKIASFLDWVIVDEETDEGEENKVIWSPK